MCQDVDMTDTADKSTELPADEFSNQIENDGQPAMLEAFDQPLVWVDGDDITHVDEDCDHIEGGTKEVDDIENTGMMTCSWCDAEPFDHDEDDDYERVTTDRQREAVDKRNAKSMASRYQAERAAAMKEAAAARRARVKAVVKPSKSKAPKSGGGGAKKRVKSVKVEKRTFWQVLLGLAIGGGAWVFAGVKWGTTRVWKKRRKIRRWLVKNPFWAAGLASLVLVLGKAIF